MSEPLNREDLDALRAEVGETVHELALRADVPARAKEKRDDVVRRVRDGAVHARDVVVEAAPAVAGRPVVLAALAAFLLGLVVIVGRRRR